MRGLQPARWIADPFLPCTKSPRASGMQPRGLERHIAGMIVHPNLTIMTVFILMTAARWLLA